MTDSTPQVNPAPVQVFEAAGVTLRVIVRDGDPWFVAADVCAALEIGNTADAVGRLDDDEKGVGSIDTLGGRQSASVVSESGLYSLILGSRKPEARAFKRWVTGEVLPSIRRTGSYGAPTAVNLRDPAVSSALLAQALQVVEEERAGRLLAEASVEAARPKVEVYDRIVDCGDTVGFRDAAKLIRAATGANENVTRGFMRQRGWIQRLDGKLAPAHVGEVRGYATTRERRFTDADGVERVRPELRITQKGVAKAIEMLIAEEEVHA